MVTLKMRRQCTVKAETVKTQTTVKCNFHVTSHLNEFCIAWQAGRKKERDIERGGEMARYARGWRGALVGLLLIKTYLN